MTIEIQQECFICGIISSKDPKAPLAKEIAYGLF